MWTRLFALPPLLLAAACGSSDTHPHEAVPVHERPVVRVGTTRGAAVVVSADERVALATNRTAGVVTVLSLDPERTSGTLVTGQTALEVNRPSGDAPEPWAAVIGADGDTGYVVDRAGARVLRVVSLRKDPHFDGEVAVGSEPTAIAIAPSGARLFVANFGEGTISVVTTNDLVEAGRIDLNPVLAGTGFLGPAAPRTALAHPRALALTDDGDGSDAGETLYATEFFSQAMEVTEDAADLTAADRDRQGLVYPIPLDGNGSVATPITIQPVADTGFKDGFGNETTCVPNQLYAARVQDGQLFVTSLCASPAGPTGPATNADGSANPGNFKTLLHPTVFVIDTKTNTEVPGNAIVLTKELESLYQGDGATSERMPLIPNDLDVARSRGSKTDRRLCLTAMGSDAVFCLSVDEGGALREIGQPGARFVDLHETPTGQVSRRPVGLALLQKSPSSFGLVVADDTQDLSAFDPAASFVTEVAPLTEGVPHAADVKDSAENSGRTLFSTGLTLWSLKGQAWSSCESCHPDGLSDGLTWFFPRGPRRTISTAGTYEGGTRRVLLWTANIDEIHDVEAIARGVAGGTGAMVWTYSSAFTGPETFRILYAGETNVPATQVAKPSTLRRDGLNGSLAELIDRQSDKHCAAASDQCDTAVGHEWDDIDAFIRSVRTPRRPAWQLDPADVATGRGVFEAARCNGCHGATVGTSWTLSRMFYTPGETNNGSVPFTKAAQADDAMAGALRSTTYEVPEELRAFNPPGKSGTAPLRRVADPDPLAAAYAPTLGDQINCVLRDVGTFPKQPQSGAPNTTGIAAPRGPLVREVRPDTSADAPPGAQTLALGASGFNIPSLLGLGLGAPYFHAGNARSLEEVFDPAFAAHYAALDPKFDPTPAEIRALVAFLLSIDDETRPEIVPDQSYSLCGSLR